MKQIVFIPALILISSTAWAGEMAVGTGTHAHHYSNIQAIMNLGSQVERLRSDYIMECHSPQLELTSDAPGFRLQVESTKDAGPETGLYPVSGSFSSGLDASKSFPIVSSHSLALTKGQDTCALRFVSQDSLGLGSTAGPGKDEWSINLELPFNAALDQKFKGKLSGKFGPHAEVDSKYSEVQCRIGPTIQSIAKECRNRETTSQHSQQTHSAPAVTDADFRQSTQPPRDSRTNVRIHKVIRAR